jgi:Arc/MetJ-type ribon-helix-helix transcriptional regulator
MQVELTKEQQEFIQRAIADGRLGQAQDAVQEALCLWVERERRREEILAAIDQADASLASGEGIEITPEAMCDLAEDVKRRGRARLAAERKVRR